MSRKTAIAITEMASKYPHLNWCGINPESTVEQIEEFFKNISDDKWLDLFLQINKLNNSQKRDWEMCVRMAYSLI